MNPYQYRKIKSTSHIFLKKYQTICLVKDVDATLTGTDSNAH